MSRLGQSEGEKTCSCCKATKSILDFYKRGGKWSPETRHSVCKECTKRRVKKRHEENPQRTRNNDLKRNYGITLEDHSRMFESQGGVCAVCKKPGDGRWSQLCVDHDHVTGKVRELLCRRCNMILGQVDDSSLLLHELAAYLRKHGC